MPTWKAPTWFRSKNFLTLAIGAVAITALYAIYIIGINENPPGFFLDESGLSYNAFLVSKIGAGEFGPKFPLYFQVYTGGYTQYSHPFPIYALAASFWFFGPSILVARMVTTASVFAACLLLGALAFRISGRRLIGALITLLALTTPWLFEIGRLVMDPFLYPLATVVLLWAVFLASNKDVWSWSNILAVAFSLTFLTYGYTIGRLFAPLLAFGLLLFAVDKIRLASVLKTWFVYTITLVPLLVFAYRTPDLMTRFSLISYVKPETKLVEIASLFVVRYIEDLNPIAMIVRGDINPRHHIPDAFGSLYLVGFLLAVIGLIVVLVRHRHESWWRYVLFGLAASVVPGALTTDPMHSLRMVAFPVFLIVLTIPALMWFVEPFENTERSELEKKVVSPRFVVLSILLALFVLEASYFHVQNYRFGSKRGYAFDSAYKELYDAAVGQPKRPIYLVDAYWGPAYIHALWYSTLEGRNPREFIHQPYGVRPPPGSLVISSELNCTDCEMIRRRGIFLLYKTLR